MHSTFVLMIFTYSKDNDRGPEWGVETVHFTADLLGIERWKSSCNLARWLHLLGEASK